MRTTTDDTQYCVLCDAVVGFERVETGDHPDDPADEWICVTCGSALLIYLNPGAGTGSRSAG
ncbi:hypothetical protein GCM10009789_82590 [Kribbella sancticallisti]|uniref:Small CPxCG-related zinc finger protein n=1 Tax=Kribbella sancticallisti TaxID=460087 RepID=A0ABN2ES37_9ACTN